MQPGQGMRPLTGHNDQAPWDPQVRSTVPTAIDSLQHPDNAPYYIEEQSFVEMLPATCKNG
jgi:hypothetical protein